MHKLTDCEIALRAGGSLFILLSIHSTKITEPYQCQALTTLDAGEPETKMPALMALCSSEGTLRTETE